MQRKLAVWPQLLSAYCFAALLTGAEALADSKDKIDARVADIKAIARTHFRPPSLPEAAALRHSLALKGRTLNFTAESGAIVFKDARGTAVADITYFSYLLEGGSRNNRPVTFAINGGPGSASAWLHIGGLGPWRLSPTPEKDTLPSAEVVPNAETWLDFTDLVFIDAASTGFSRVHSHDEGLQRTFFSFDGDIAALSVFVRRWLEAHGRHRSPKVFLGESYAGLRAPHIAKILAGRPETALKAVILVSPVLAPSAPWPASHTDKVPWEVLDLPSAGAHFAARRGEPSLQHLPEFERYAMEEYRADLARQQDTAAAERLTAGLAVITGLEQDKIRELGTSSRVATPRDLVSPLGTFTTLPTQRRSKSGALIIQTVSFPHEIIPEYDLNGPMQQSVVALAKAKFGWAPERDYEMRGSSWSRTGLESMTPLRTMLARDPKFRVLVAHGAADFTTPYFTSKVLLKPLLGDGPGKITFKVYEGLHMFYFRDDSRVEFRRDAASFFESIAR